MRLAVAGGGTGGHVYPIMSVLSTMQLRRPDLPIPTDVLYLGSDTGIEAGLARDAGISFRAVAVAPIRGTTPLRTMINLIKNGVGIIQSVAILRQEKVQAVLGTGGYSSVPVVMAAWLLGIPSLVYLPDAYPGWAVRFLAKFASRIAVTSSEAESHLKSDKAVVTGYPVRPDFFLLNKAAARHRLSINESCKMVLVMGGSQGSHTINKTIGDALESLTESTEVIHICGKLDMEWLKGRKLILSPDSRTKYHLHDYLNEELPSAMVAADLVICRSGASVLGELPAAGLPGILVPYPYAGGHQRHNAKVMMEAGAALIVEEAEIDQLVPAALELVHDDQRRLSMETRCRRMSMPDAAESIYLQLEELVRGNGQLKLQSGLN
ncbi:MAG: undecaprenyldiphospho-muramoylpentapeptide beta-N-acetylglucosaminyltransferase [Dehalococcoidia bacterium]|nr:undecaprenyldiphospho-muramoylpentapeptide beta-N-acetylglucosaminyltransferase [Dehalococcoidia bacterium]